MKYLILVSSIILCVSCASSRQEFSQQRSSSVTSVQMTTGSEYLDKLLQKLAAKFSDSVIVVVENYYPPKSDSDSVGPLRAKVTYQRSSKSEVDKTEQQEIQSRNTTDIHRNDSTRNDKVVEIEKEASSFSFNVNHIVFGCLALLALYGWAKKLY